MDDQNRCMRCMGQKDSQQETCPACGFSEKDFVPEKHHLQPHTILKGQYLVGCALGEGGFGITYIGWDMFLHIPVAIKEYFPSGVVIRDQGQHTVSVFAGKDEESFLQGRSSFFREAQKVAKFDNNVGVVSVKNCFLENGTAYIIMEYISGINLGAYAELHGGKLTFTETLKLLRTPILTLEELHRASTWHRDISPENLMLTKDGKVKLIDFGSAMESDREKKTRVLMIRAGYSPVEMYSSTGEDGPYSDVYSMAATIYKLITGVTPPPATDRLDNDPLVPPSALGVKDISHAQEAALLKGMAVQVKSRYQTMEEFFDGLYGKNAPEPASKAAADRHCGAAGADYGGRGRAAWARQSIRAGRTCSDGDSDRRADRDTDRLADGSANRSADGDSDRSTHRHARAVRRGNGAARFPECQRLRDCGG